jgi:hypothetical protein
VGGTETRIGPIFAQSTPFQSLHKRATIRSVMANAHVTNFARIDFRNDDRMFGIKDMDRFSHVYIILNARVGPLTQRRMPSAK